MFKSCGALVLGLLVLSSSPSFAQCRNISPAQYASQYSYNNGYGAQVASGAYYDARSGGRYVNPGYVNPLVANNVAVYQAQLNQSYQVGANGYLGQGYNQYNNGYNAGYVNPYGNAYTAGFNQITVQPQYSPNQVGYVGVNPWNGYGGNSYNGYSYQMQGQGRHHHEHEHEGGRFWLNR